MWGWRKPVFLLLIAACSSDRTAPGHPPEVPQSLASTTLDQAVVLTWSDNAFTTDPGNFQNYRVYSSAYDVAAETCTASLRLEGTTVAPEFLVGALPNGVQQCFTVSAVAIDGSESGRSAVVSDTPRPDARNVVLFARQYQNSGSGFRFWNDINGDNLAQENEVGLIGLGSDPEVDFSVERDIDTGALFLTPRRAGTGVEFYSDVPVEDLTSIDVAPCLPAPDPGDCGPYATSPIEASPGFAYVFEMQAADPFLRFGALRVTHVGQNLLIADWAYQTDPGNPELLVGATAATP